MLIFKKPKKKKTKNKKKKGNLILNYPLVMYLLAHYLLFPLFYLMKKKKHESPMNDTSIIGPISRYMCSDHCILLSK